MKNKTKNILTILLHMKNANKNVIKIVQKIENNPFKNRCGRKTLQL